MSYASDPRLPLAGAAYEFIVREMHAHVGAGGCLHSAGSNGLPRRLRPHIERLTRTVAPRYATAAGLAAWRQGQPVEVDHVWPVKWLAIELAAPQKHDQRHFDGRLSAWAGPVRSAEHLLELVDRFCALCYLVPEEHRRVNRTRGCQWNAPNGDGFARYRRAGLAVFEIMGDESEGEDDCE